MKVEEAIDPSVGADCRISRRIFIRWESDWKYSDMQIGKMT